MKWWPGYKHHNFTTIAIIFCHDHRAFSFLDSTFILESTSLNSILFLNSTYLLNSVSLLDLISHLKSRQPPSSPFFKRPPPSLLDTIPLLNSTAQQHKRINTQLLFPPPPPSHSSRFQAPLNSTSRQTSEASTAFLATFALLCNHLISNLSPNHKLAEKWWQTDPKLSLPFSNLSVNKITVSQAIFMP